MRSCLLRRWHLLTPVRAGEPLMVRLLREKSAYEANVFPG